MLKQKLLAIAVLFFCCNPALHASYDIDDPFDEPIIEFMGRKKPAVELICEAKDAPNSHLFATTKAYELIDPNEVLQASEYAIEHVKQGAIDEKFRHFGTVLQMPDYAIDQVQQGNFVYSPFYTFEKTHLSGGDYAKIAIIVTGTKEQSKIDILHYQAIRKMSELRATQE